MAIVGEIVNNEVLRRKVLRNLAQRWNHVALIIEERKILSTLYFDQLVGYLMFCKEKLRDSFGKSDVKDFSSKLQITKNEHSKSITKRNQGQGSGQNQNHSIGNRGGCGLSGRGEYPMLPL